MAVMKIHLKTLLLFGGLALLLASFFVSSPLMRDAVAQDSAVNDPLARFKKSQSAQNTNNGTPPLPTPGAYQQPMNQNGDQQSSLQELDYEAQMALQERQRELEQLTREQAFEAALNTLMPMSPEEIEQLLEKFRISREAGEKRVGGVPKPEIAVQTVSLDPGATPPTIKLSPGHVTSVNIMDITGKPWPVETLSWGGEFEIISPPEGGHIIRISPLKAHGIGNLSVQLLELDTPITFTLLTQLESVQYRFDARVPEYGPYADMPIIDAGITTTAGTDPSVSTILQGVLPTGATLMKVEGTDGRTTVYRHNGNTLVRTPLSLLSPGWSESIKSADGMTVYVISNTPVLLLSDRGKMVRAYVSEREVQ